MQDKCPKCGEPLITRTIKKQLGYGSIDYPVAQECPKGHYSKDLTGAGDIVSRPLAPEPKKETIKPPAPPKAAPSKAVPTGAQPLPSANLNKVITVVLAILVLGGIVWAFFPYPASQPQKPANVTTPTATPTVTQTSVQTTGTGTPVPEVTPTGVTLPIKLERYRGFLGLVNGTLEIKPGDNVVWTNEGTETLTLVSSDGLFENRLLSNGKRTNYTFLKPGTYNFYLKENSSLRGTVSVEP